MQRRSFINRAVIGTAAGTSTLAAAGGVRAQARRRDRPTFVFVHGAWHGGWCWSEVVRLLAAYPETRVSHPKRTLYDAVEAAELDEPGAMKALIELKLSANAQFQDRPGACKLIETAVGRGDQSMAQRLADCRAN